MTISRPPSPRPPAARRSRSRPAFAIVLAAVIVAGGCGSAAWYVGLFTSNGRFDRLDACTLLPPPARLVSLVRNGAREPGDSRPKTFFGFGNGDARSECKWSSVPPGQDLPFRTVRIHTETKIRDGRVSAERRAREALTTSYANATARQGTPARPGEADLGEQGYTTTDTMEIRIVFTRTVIYDLHAEFRISNALIDVSARTHTAPGDRERALVLALAKTIADRLNTTG